MLISSALLAAASGLVALAKPINGPGVATSHVEARFINTTIASVCQSLNTQTTVYGPLSLPYTQDSAHYMISSSQVPTCLVKPKTASELSSIMKVVAARRVAFAVSCGGHSSNQGFSSTSGVHITLNGLTLDGTNGIKLSDDKNLITYTPGRVWDSIYDFMGENSPNTQAVGGRVGGVGVGGFVIAGGGYSWLSNEHGLVIDTMVSAQVVLPNATIVTASATENSELFFGIRGAGNEFGIVTAITARTVPTEPMIYGGISIYGPDALDELAAATADFSRNNKDVKANTLPTFNALAGIPGVILITFYNGATPPANTFAAFDNIKAKPVFSDKKTRTWSDFVGSVPSDAAANSRGAFHTISVVNNSPKFLSAILSELKKYALLSDLHSGLLISYDVEPFVKSYFNQSKGGAYPHSASRPLVPLNLYFSWLNPAEDDFWRNEMKKSAALLLDVARQEGQKVDPIIRYPNYALADTPLSELYGDNLPRLKALKKVIDPTRVMDLAGGFKIPF